MQLLTDVEPITEDLFDRCGVYVLTIIVDGTIRYYIGMTLRSFRERLNEHLRARKTHHNDAIQEAKQSGGVILASVYYATDTPPDEWHTLFIQRLERLLINYYKSRGAPLANEV